MSVERLLAVLGFLFGLPLLVGGVEALWELELWGAAVFLPVGGMAVFGGLWADRTRARGQDDRFALGFMLAFGISSMCAGGLCSSGVVASFGSNSPYAAAMFPYVVLPAGTLVVGVIVTRRALSRRRAVKRAEAPPP